MTKASTNENIARVDGEGVLTRIEVASSGLPDRLLRIARWIAGDPAAAAAATIADVAKLTGTSPASVNRLCHALGYAGYAELRVAVATENGRLQQTFWGHTVGAEIQADDSVQRIADIIASADARAMQRTLERLDTAAIDRLVEAIGAARRVCLFGIGGSYYAADELRARLQLIGIPTWAWLDVHDGLAAAAVAGRDTTFIGVSHSGHTAETIEVLTEARRSGAMTAAMTSTPDSPLAAGADLVLVTSVEQTSTFRTQSFAARHSQLFLLDVIFVAVAHRAHERSATAYDSARKLISAHQASVTGGPKRRRSHHP